LITIGDSPTSIPKPSGCSGGLDAQLLGQVIWDLLPEAKGTPIERDFRQAAADRATLELEA
jgi:hypothetical protein